MGQGWWQLLWLPPSMPYFQLGEPFASHAGITKRLVFSSWSATPTAIAGLLSYEAERQLVDGRLPENSARARAAVASRLDYRLDGDRPAAMSALALFWPNAALAELGDPLAIARSRPDDFLRRGDVEDAARERLLAQVPDDVAEPAERETAAWTSFFSWPGAVPAIADDELLTALSGGAPDGQDDVERPAADGRAGLAAHAELALASSARATGARLGRGEDAVQDIVRLAVHSPGNIAWRALSRVLRTGDAVSPDEHWRAAAHLAAHLRGLFNRLESTLLLDRGGDDNTYWRVVLDYCAAGNLQAVLDEYLHHLRSSVSDVPPNGDALMSLVNDVVRAVGLRPAAYAPYYPLDDDGPRLRSRFALRYGSPRGVSTDAAAGIQIRQQDVRTAFNSPFWPFVLATTSVGQEGIDFHWWCSAIVHWNTPTNPVDFEQREGRVHRFGGHAVRRNVSAAHRPMRSLGRPGPVESRVRRCRRGHRRPGRLRALLGLRRRREDRAVRLPVRAQP